MSRDLPARITNNPSVVMKPSTLRQVAGNLAKGLINAAAARHLLPDFTLSAPPTDGITAENCAREAFAFLTEISTGQFIERSAPRTADGHLHWKFRAWLQERIENSYVLVLRRGHVWGRLGAVFTPDNRLVWDVSREFYVGHWSDHSAFFQLIGPARRVRGRVAVLATDGSHVFYHWMCDVLPRLRTLELSGDLPSIDKFIVDYRGLPFQRDTLAELGVPLEKIIPATDNRWFHIEADELVVPSLPSRMNSVSPWASDYLRDRFGQRSGAPRHLIYVSRQRAIGRRIRNEGEVCRVLEERGFRTIVLESMPPIEQRLLFSQARVVIGPHGGGLTNVLFQQPGTALIDLFAPGWVNPCFWTIADAGQVRYGYVIGPGDHYPEGVEGLSQGEDITVDLSALDAALHGIV
ncbi:MAG: glycosyltransferase family 61 protein [Acidobacteriaceae bacterium]|nr:glycosyltransferase family 61 protein [Acidobacteriaceae bacterium]